MSLLSRIPSLKDVEYTKFVSSSDYVSAENVSDLNPDENHGYRVEEINGEYVVTVDESSVLYLPSQTENPGKLISDLRERGIGESLGRASGRQAYDQIPEDDRVKDEEEINRITEEFNNELQKIAECGKILNDKNATIEQKREALENIKECKTKQRALFESSKELFKAYMENAKEIYSNPADERTDEDLVNLLQIENSWEDSEKNLESDVKAIDNTMSFLDNPQKLFKEPSAPKGTVDTDYYIDIPPIGVFNGIQMWPSEEREIADLSYDNSVHNAEPQSQEQEGIISTSSIEKVTVKTTRYGINAFMHKFKNFAKDFLNKISGKETNMEVIDDKSNDERD